MIVVHYSVFYQMTINVWRYMFGGRTHCYHLGIVSWDASDHSNMQ